MTFWLLLATVNAAPPLKPVIHIAELDRTRLSGDKHLIWFRLMTKVNVVTLLDICITNASSTTCSSTVTAHPEDTSQAVFVISPLSDSSTLSIRLHNLREELAVERVPRIPLWSRQVLVGWMAALGALLGTLFWVYGLQRKLARDRALAQKPLAEIQKTLSELSIRDKTLMGDLGTLQKHFDEALSNEQKLAKTVEGLATGQGAMEKRAEMAVATLRNGLIDAAALVAAPAEIRLQQVLWFAMRARHAEPQAPLAAILDFVAGFGYEPAVMNLHPDAVTASYFFLPNPIDGEWLLTAIPGSASKLLSALVRRPSATDEVQKDLLGITGKGRIVQLERPCRLEPSKGAPGGYVVGLPGVVRLEGEGTGPYNDSLAELVKRVNALVMMSGTRAQSTATQLEQRLAALEQRLKAPAQIAAAARASTGLIVSSPVASIPPVASSQPKKIEPVILRPPGMYPMLEQAWWGNVVASAASNGDGSAEDYLGRVLRLRDGFQKAFVNNGMEFIAFVAWVRREKEDPEERFRMIRAREAEGEVFVQEPDRPERELVGRFLFQLFVAIEDSARKGILLFVPAGTFDVGQHSTVLLEIVENPEEGARNVKGILHAAELWKEQKNQYRLNSHARLVLEYASEEDE